MMQSLKVLKQQGPGAPVHGVSYGLLALSAAVVTIMAYRHVGVPSKHFKALLMLSGASAALATVASCVSFNQWRENRKVHQLELTKTREASKSVVAQVGTPMGPQSIVLASPAPSPQKHTIERVVMMPPGAFTPAYGSGPAQSLGSGTGGAYGIQPQPLAIMPPSADAEH
jgi:hypothetical protein